MNKTTKRAYALYPVIALFLVGTLLLTSDIFLHGASWASNRANKHIYLGGQISSAGMIYDINGKTLAKTVDGDREFASSSRVRRATLHIVGDTAGKISTGAHSIFKSELSGYSFLNGVYSLKKYGTGSDLTLTVDADVCLAAYRALGSRNGTVGVYNYLTGELVCCVSAPTYDPEDEPEDILTDSDYDGVFLNRLFSGVYTPGSVMKIVTAVCAVENLPDIYMRRFTCNGSCNLGSGKIICNDSHGEISFEQALAKSCNCAFAELGAELGAERLTAAAKALGFNTPMKTGDGVKLAMSTFSLDEASRNDIGWAAVGQYTTLLNPCHMMMLLGAIANGGKGLSPHVESRLTGSSGRVLESGTSKTGISISSETAAALNKLLRSNVSEGYGDGNFPGLTMCGKTGTAELDEGESHSWFVGYSQDTDFPYAVVVVIENGGSGYYNALPVANKVLQELRGD